MFTVRLKPLATTITRPSRILLHGLSRRPAFYRNNVIRFYSNVPHKQEFKTPIQEQEAKITEQTKRAEKEEIKNQQEQQRREENQKQDLNKEEEKTFEDKWKDLYEEDDSPVIRKQNYGKYYSLLMYLILIFGTISGTYYFKKYLESTPDFKETQSYGEAFKGVWSAITFRKKKLQEPLIPPIDDPANARPTIVINLEDFLVHRFYTVKTGWKTQKRPGVDEFLRFLCENFEVVIFSDGYWMNNVHILEQLDPYHQTIRVFRDKMVYRNKKYVKDLKLLGRDLNKVILIDHNEEGAYGQEANFIKVKPWKGDTRDRTLLELIPFIKWALYEPDVPVQLKLQRFRMNEGAEEALQVFKEAAQKRQVFIPPDAWFSQ